ncbi:TetR/AcrR family transcriptional regulator [Actinocorallia sp. A-T 12471]|uniref:TetR/AcrR family transcriptional regulator n=1 Tax=Actinocorallia sp. A-T 12471 TaxID=3089813 RepID=UPI0029D061A9|nr:TetR/AcrR family transcriptional regulator [Actinocorallia sp. A-T 12471]MDX6741120.1 TetR/AcrR family transcriptional regulator [Actinocorallia sp. A-T 12471]
MAGEDGDCGVLDVALRLFANLGYDGTTTEMIAAAAGVRPEEVPGGRNGLYHAMLRRFQDQQLAVFDQVPEISAEGDLHDVLDHLLDFYLDHRLELMVWQHRGLSDATDIAGAERDYRTPVTERLFEVVAALEKLPDPEMWISVVTWSLTGFVSGGIITQDAEPADADDYRARRRFRAFMHKMMEAVGPR